MTTQGRAIITGIQILPPTDYGEYRFRRDIAGVISRVMGRKDLTERILSRMTDQGILVWSRTGRMAKVVDPEKSYRIVMKSEGGTKRTMYTGLDEETAYDICRDYGWKVDFGYVWQLEIEEE